jgi:hypothetical protein
MAAIETMSITGPDRRRNKTIASNGEGRPEFSKADEEVLGVPAMPAMAPTEVALAATLAPRSPTRAITMAVAQANDPTSPSAAASGGRRSFTTWTLGGVRKLVLVTVFCSRPPADAHDGVEEHLGPTP